MPTNGFEQRLEDQKLKVVFQERAKALQTQPEMFRFELMTSLICDSVAIGIPDEAEYFAAAFNDPAGREYWRAHLSEPMRIGAFGYLLSVHLRIKPEELQSARIAITLALQTAASTGERLFVGDVAPLLTFKALESDFDSLLDLKVRPRAAVLWLLGKPKRQNLVPDSLRNFVEREPTNKQRPITNHNAQEFVTEYISKEKAASRHPTLVALESAAKAAGFRGDRELLREAFRRSPDVEVKQGRPTKRAK